MSSTTTRNLVQPVNKNHVRRNKLPFTLISISLLEAEVRWAIFLITLKKRRPRVDVGKVGGSVVDIASDKKKETWKAEQESSRWSSQGASSRSESMSIRSVIVINKWSATTQIVISHSIMEKKKIAFLSKQNLPSLTLDTNFRSSAALWPYPVVIAVKPVFCYRSFVREKFLWWARSFCEERIWWEETASIQMVFSDLCHRYYELRPITIPTFWEVIHSSFLLKFLQRITSKKNEW